MKRIVARSTIAKLNAKARSIARQNPEKWMPDVLDDAATAIGLKFYHKTSDTTVEYINKQRGRVNCWLEGPHSQELIDGGAGFDDQIED